ncbi:MAG: 1-acyl-sn-glycerol-3-phosphate acyltransferase [Archangiaceae bacterium]|nr:1-acyl-sn-glycerol-3-phosphate acyltransferase [Archangiaceae bacterium]
MATSLDPRTGAHRHRGERPTTRLRRAALGLYTYAEFLVLALVFLPIMAVVAVFTARDPGRRLRGRWMRRFGRLTSDLTPLWRFTVEGRRPPGIDHRGFVVVSNHQSSADPFLLSHLPWDMRWIAKAEAFKAPLSGWLIRLGGDIPLQRGVRASIERMLAAARATLAAGMSVMVFPEGTRSPDGRLQPFKDGAFNLAIEAQVPVLPVVLHGTRECRPKGSLWFGDASAVARVLEPISTVGLTLVDAPALRERVRERIARELAAMA